MTENTTCRHCGRPGGDLLGHYHNELATHIFQSEAYFQFRQLRRFLIWLYGV